MLNYLYSPVRLIFVSLLFLVQEGLSGITNPTLVSDAYGNSICIEVSAGSCEGEQEIRAAYKSFDSDWQIPEIISEGFSYKDHLIVQKDREENIFVAWIGLDKSNETYSLYANTWIASQQIWGGVSQISNDGKMLCGKCSIALGDEKTLVMWSEYGPTMKPVTSVKAWVQGQWLDSSSFSR